MKPTKPIWLLIGYVYYLDHCYKRLGIHQRINQRAFLAVDHCTMVFERHLVATFQCIGLFGWQRLNASIRRIVW